jgi:hypothetical protein
MVERHAFLRGLTWLCPFEPYGGDCWPPKPLGMLSEAAAGQQRRPRPLASRIILKDCTCCLTRGRDVLFFAAAAAGAAGAEAAADAEDPAQMSFSMALMEVNPRAARAALRDKRRRERGEERRRQRQRQQEEEEEEEQRRRQPPPPPEEPSGSASSGSSSLLLLPPPPAARRRQQRQQQQEEEEEWRDEGEEDGDDNDPSSVVPALFFRIDGKVYLVDHTAIETIVCPRLGEEDQQVPQLQQQQQQQGDQPQAPPPYAAFKLPTVTLRFWLARLSLSPLNATQPLVSAVDALSRALTPRAWVPPPLDPPLPYAVGHDDGGGEWAVGQVEACLRAVDTFLMPPLARGWAPGEGGGLLRVAGRAFARVRACWDDLGGLEWRDSV